MKRNEKNVPGNGRRLRRSRLVQIPAPDSLRIETLLLRSVVLRLLEQIIKGAQGSTTKGRDAINKRLAYAEKTGELAAIMSAEGKRYAAGDLFRWAANAWPNVSFDGYPIRPAQMQLGGVLGDATLTSTAVTLPSSIDECRSELLSSKELIAELRAEVARLENEVSVLKPKAMNWDERIVAKNVRNASGKRSNT